MRRTRSTLAGFAALMCTAATVTAQSPTPIPTPVPTPVAPPATTGPAPSTPPATVPPSTPNGPDTAAPTPPGPNRPANLSPEDRPYAWAAGAMRRLVAVGVWPAAETSLAATATRRQLARGLAAIVATRQGAYGSANTGPPPPDVTAADHDARAIGITTARRLFGAPSAPFRPDAPVTARQAQGALMRALGLQQELRGTAGIRTADGARLRVPSGFAAAVISRELGLRHNYPSAVEGLERPDSAPTTVADLVGMIDVARTASPWTLERLAAYRDVTLPDMSPAQRTVVQAALHQVGTPYVWGGDWPTSASPWGPQAVGGFDCSGLVWMAFKGAPASVALGLGTGLIGRTADDMAWERPAERLRVADLAAGDLVFFGDRGPRTPRGGIGHVGIALGGGWMVHSSGSRAGASLSRLDTYWVSGQSWARRPAPFGPPPAVVAPNAPPPNAAPATVP